MSTFATTGPAYHSPPGPFHAILLAGSVPLFLGAFLSDLAYFKTFQIQWSNFASWLIAGGLFFCGLALLAALIELIRAQRKSGRPLMYFLALLVTWVLGLVNAFQHAKDAWAAMPSGLILSAVVLLFICATAWVRLTPHAGGPG